jgi:hypothetical protein
MITFFLSGYVCGPFRPETILSTRKTISKEIKTSASSKREQIENVLVKVARKRCLALSPEIFCLPFYTPNKKAHNVLKVRIGKL